MRYSIMGNCKTAALVHETGSIDWCCFPNFDSASLFGKILDPEAGFFSFSMASHSKVSQSYLSSTNILHEKIEPPSFGYSWQMFEKTKEYWESWSSHCRLPSVCREEVLRSALALKLMTFEDTGAIVAAPLAKALHSIGEKDRGWLLFENILSKANYVGLLSEDIDPDTEELLGNFLQAYSHMAVINTANVFGQEET